MRPLKERISITIDSDLLEKLREKSDEDCRPLSQYINLVLRKHVEQEEKKQKQIPLQRAAGRIKQLKAQRDNPLCLFLCNYNLMSASLLPLPLVELAERGR